LLNRPKEAFIVPIKPRGQFRLDLVPMINIVFLLLIFFMLTSSAFKQSEKVDLPEVESSELKTEKNITLLITSQKQVEYEGESISLDALLPVLQGELHDREKKIVEIQADKAVEFKLFGDVIDVAKQAGAVDFILATDAMQSE